MDVEPHYPHPQNPTQENKKERSATEPAELIRISGVCERKALSSWPVV